MGSRDKNKKRKRSRRDSSSSSSDSEDDVRQQLQRQRQAVLVLRDLLGTHPAVRKELREMLWTIDQGKAADVSGVPDLELKEAIKKLLKLLGLHKSGKDLYSLASGSDKTLQVLGFVFDESPEALVTAAKAKAAAAAAAAEAKEREKAEKERAAAQRAAEKERVAAEKVAAEKAEREGQRAREGDGEGQGHGRGSAGAIGESGGPGDGAAGPGEAVGRPSGAALGAAGEAGSTDGPAPAPVPAPAPAPVKRQLGPAMPSAAMLAAAAAHMREVEEEEEQGDGDEDLVGPVPPELVSEMDAVPQDEREAEVFRILAIIREAATPDPALGPLAPSAPGAPPPAPDAYLILGVDSSAPSAEVKKRYMRLSLLIHPDKCKHKDAHTAFQAVAKAAKTLQDSGARQALDSQLEDAELRRMAVRAAAQQERERQWRVAKGLVDPEADAAAAAAAAAVGGPQKREAWMTELPPERVAPNKIEQISQRTFSRTGFKPRGDTSSWTDTPEQRDARAAGLIGTAGPAVLAIGPAPGIGLSSGAAFSMDEFNSQHRRKTLVEEHLERLAKGESLKPPAKTQGASKPAAAAAEVPSARGSAEGRGRGEESGSSSGSSDSGSGSSGSDGEGDRRRGSKRSRRDDSRKSSKGKRKKDKDKGKKKKKSEKEKKKSRKDDGKARQGGGPVSEPAAKQEAWEGEHPWRPFDRDKDLELKRKASLNPAQLIKNAAGMNASRFQSAGGTRHFL